MPMASFLLGTEDQTCCESLSLSYLNLNCPFCHVLCPLDNACGWTVKGDIAVVEELLKHRKKGTVVLIPCYHIQTLFGVTCHG
jgi:hypothetical protein